MTRDKSWVGFKSKKRNFKNQALRLNFQHDWSKILQRKFSNISYNKIAQNLSPFPLYLNDNNLYFSS